LVRVVSRTYTKKCGLHPKTGQTSGVCAHLVHAGGGGVSAKEGSGHGSSHTGLHDLAAACLHGHLQNKHVYSA